MRKRRLFAPKCFRCGVQHLVCPQMAVRSPDLSLRIAWAVVMVMGGMAKERAHRVTGVSVTAISSAERRLAAYRSATSNKGAT